jgi:IS5 family transposase
MAHKNLHQMTFGDFTVKFKQKLNSSLDQINRTVNWIPIHNLLTEIYNSKRGPKSYPPLMVFKALLIQTWYNLSDYELEEALDDRLSFRRFAGLGVGDSTPDHSTYSNFRKQLEEKGLAESIFYEINKQLEKSGRIVKKGTIVDATLVEAAVKKPDQKEDGSAGTSDVDPEAEWVCKGSKRYFGYKAHIAVDADSGLIRKAALTRAKAHEGHVLKDVLPPDQEWVYADKAYESKANSKLLKDLGIKNGIMNKASRRVKLKSFHRLRNRLISKTRQKIERTFGTFKRWYDYVKVRYIGIERNSVQMFLICIGFNLKSWSKTA